MFDKYFYFLRHGQTEYNIKALITGKTDIPLDNTGIEQSKSARNIVKKLKIKSCISSPQLRAIQTAKIIFGDTFDIQIKEKLHERSWGTLEGTPKNEIDGKDFTKHCVEPFEDFKNRVIETLINIKSPEPIAIVAHSGTFRVLEQHLKIDQNKKKPITNASPYIFYHTKGMWHIKEILD